MCDSSVPRDRGDDRIHRTDSSDSLLGNAPLFYSSGKTSSVCQNVEAESVDAAIRDVAAEKTGDVCDVAAAVVTCGVIYVVAERTRHVSTVAVIAQTCGCGLGQEMCWRIAGVRVYGCSFVTLDLLSLEPQEGEEAE